VAITTPTDEPELTSLDRITYDDSRRLARALALDTAAAPLLLSIDLDFFISAPQPGVDPDQLVRLTDWVGDERRSVGGATARWRERERLLRRFGWEPSNVLRLDDQPSPRRLAATLQHRFLLPAGGLLADSHAYGLVALERLVAAAGRPVELVSFDTHHDAGYRNFTGDTPALAAERVAADVGCDDWVWAGLERGLIEQATIVYPDWRGLLEWRTLQPPVLPAALSQHISALSFCDWASQPASRRTVGDLIITRSSEWIPPWLEVDAALIGWAYGLGPQLTCLDCHPQTARYRIGSWDACTPRVWLDRR